MLARLLLGALAGAAYASCVWLAALYPNGGNGLVWVPVVVGGGFLIVGFLSVLIGAAR